MNVHKGQAFLLPSKDEQDVLRDNTQLFQSNLRQSEVGELLKEVTYKVSNSHKVERILFDLRDILCAAPSKPSVTVTELCSLGIRTFRSDTETILDFVPPTRIDIVGSYVLETIASPSVNIDVAIQMSPAMFHPSDFKNHVYFKKRSLFLGHIATILRMSGRFGDISASSFHGDQNKCVLLLRPKSKKVSVVIRLLPSAAGIFSLEKLSPRRCNVRQETCITASPRYNNAILEDMMLRDHLQFQHNVMSEFPAFKECCVLAKVWAHQRQYNQQRDSVNGWLLSMLVCHLYCQKKINKHMTPFSAFCTLLKHLATEQLLSTPIFLSRRPGVTVETFSCYEVVFVDNSGLLNIASHISAEALLEIQRDAEITLQNLETRGFGGFEAAFIRKTPFCRKFDVYVTVSVNQSNVLDEGFHGSIPDYRQSMSENSVRWKLHATISRALSDRVTSCRSHVLLPERWSLEELPPTPAEIHFGLLIEPQKFNRVVDRGPGPENEILAKEFRNFWKDKADLRRFKDGSIGEAIIWSSKPAMVVRELLDYALTMHHNFVSTVCVKDALQLFEGATFEARALAAGQAFHILSEDMRELADLPVKIKTVQAIDPLFRQTRPIVSSRSKTREGENTILSVLATLEGNVKWPESLVAIQAIKKAILLKLGDSLRIIPELKVCAIAETCIFVKCKGFTFCIGLHIDRELTVMQKATELHCSVVPSFRSGRPEEDTIAQSKLPLHANYVQALNAQAITFPRCVRAASRWAHKQLLSIYLDLETVELIMAYVFLTAPSQTPKTEISGLARFLELLVTFDWAHEPLIVDFKDDMTASDRARIRDVFIEQKTRDKKSAMFIASTVDRETDWSPKWGERIDLTIMAYLKSSAFLTLSNMDANLLQCSRSWTKFFSAIPNANSMDMWIDINQQAIVPAENLPTDVLWQHTNPLFQLVMALDNHLHSIALFFVDTLGSSSVGVLFKPVKYMPGKKWAAERDVGHLLADELAAGTESRELYSQSSISPSAVLSEIYRIGGAMIRRVRFV